MALLVNAALAVQRPVVVRNGRRLHTRFSCAPLRPCAFCWPIATPPQRCGGTSSHCGPAADGEAEASPLPSASSLAIEQRANVLQQLVGTDRAVAMVTDEAADHLVCLLELFGVRRL